MTGEGTSVSASLAGASYALWVDSFFQHLLDGFLRAASACRVHRFLVLGLK